MSSLLKILQGDSKISLRIIDWFVTNYSKKNNITYPIVIKRPNGSRIRKQFMVFLDYKSQLKAFSKKEFDPFCRRNRITFEYTRDPDDYIVTTVGQLNFFRWAIHNKIINYIESHLEEIEDDMNLATKHIYCKNRVPNKIKKSSRVRGKGRQSKKKHHQKIGLFKSRKKVAGGSMSKKKRNMVKNRKKRKELSVAATNRLNHHKTNIIVKFD
tara:strand:- start:171 stop:806 length:636 start_codon:yes stop_codon:yes gene_type:complete